MLTKEEAHCRIVRISLWGLKLNNDVTSQCFDIFKERNIRINDKDFEFIFGAGYLLAMKDVMEGRDSTL